MYDYVAAVAPTTPSQGEEWWDTSRDAGFVRVGNAWLPVAGESTTIPDLPASTSTPGDAQMVVHSASQSVGQRDRRIDVAAILAGMSGLPSQPHGSGSVTFDDATIKAIPGVAAIPAGVRWIGVAPEVPAINRVYWCLRSQLFAASVSAAAAGDAATDGNRVPLETRDIAGVGAIVLGLHRTTTGVPLISWGGRSLRAGGGERRHLHRVSGATGDTGPTSWRPTSFPARDPKEDITDGETVAALFVKPYCGLFVETVDGRARRQSGRGAPALRPMEHIGRDGGCFASALRRPVRRHPRYSMAWDAPPGAAGLVDTATADVHGGKATTATLWRSPWLSRRTHESGVGPSGRPATRHGHRWIRARTPDP